MKNISKTFLFILVVSCCFVSTISANAKSKAPSKAELEEIFGKQVNCLLREKLCSDEFGKEIKCPEPKTITCFKYREIIIKAEFNSKQYAKRISIYDGCKFDQVLSASHEIMMLKGRGRFLKKNETTEHDDCTTDFVAEYEYLTLEERSKNCMGCLPGGITLIWKK